MKATSTDNRLNHVDIHSASYGIACDSSSTDVMKLTLENSVIHNVGGEGLGLYHCRASVGNTQISNTLGHCVAVVGGWAEFVHCTLAQFILGMLRGRCLVFGQQMVGFGLSSSMLIS